MAAEDELFLPTVPTAKSEDPEDVSWALSTAEAMWARGDHLEGIKWVRRAAEAASEAEADMRALELAKAAADLTTLLTRRSSAGGDGASAAAAPPAPAPKRASATPPPPSMKPPAPAGSPSVKPPPVATSPSAPPAPPVPPSSRPAASAPPRALATPARAQGPQPGKGVLSNRTAPDDKDKKEEKRKGRRRSRENLEADARAAAALGPPPEESGKTLVMPPNALPGFEGAPPSEKPRSRRRSSPDFDATVIAKVEEIVQAGGADMTPAWDQSPTEDLTGPELDEMGDRRTVVGAAPVAVATAAAGPGVPAPGIGAPAAANAPNVANAASGPSVAGSSPPPTRSNAAPSVVPPARRPSRMPPAAVHDPEIQTSQAVRVVVWRDANGVHIAPAGTVVSSITIDAVLVALEPTADLTAWLSSRAR